MKNRSLPRFHSRPLAFITFSHGFLLDRAFQKENIDASRAPENNDSLTIAGQNEHPTHCLRLGYF
jgi:hypothetical protein